MSTPAAAGGGNGSTPKVSDPPYWLLICALPVHAWTGMGAGGAHAPLRPALGPDSTLARAVPCSGNATTWAPAATNPPLSVTGNKPGGCCPAGAGAMDQAMPAGFLLAGRPVVVSLVTSIETVLTPGVNLTGIAVTSRVVVALTSRLFNRNVW